MKAMPCVEIEVSSEGEGAIASEREWGLTSPPRLRSVACSRALWKEAVEAIFHVLKVLKKFGRVLKVCGVEERGCVKGCRGVEMVGGVVNSQLTLLGGLIFPAPRPRPEIILSPLLPPVSYLPLLQYQKHGPGASICSSWVTRLWAWPCLRFSVLLEDIRCYRKKQSSSYRKFKYTNSGEAGRACSVGVRWGTLVNMCD